MANEKKFRVRKYEVPHIVGENLFDGTTYEYQYHFEDSAKFYANYGYHNWEDEFFNQKYLFNEWHHALAILKYEFPEQFFDVIDVLTKFTLKKSEIMKAGGRKSPISDGLDQQLYQLGWEEKMFETKVQVDGLVKDTPTHKIDCVKGRVALDIEWNNKDPFYDRDLNNFRLLHSLGAISVGIIVTRHTELQTEIFKPLDIHKKYGSSTTHYDKLFPKIQGGGAGMCPILVFAIRAGAYDENA
jgi:hypothetical protein